MVRNLVPFIVENATFLAVILLVPMAVCAFVSRRTRWVIFFLGLILYATNYFPFTRGAHNPLGLLPFLGIAMALAALLVDFAAFALRGFRRRARE
jgi:hypothetical protein